MNDVVFGLVLGILSAVTIGYVTWVISTTVARRGSRSPDLEEKMQTLEAISVLSDAEDRRLRHCYHQDTRDVPRPYCTRGATDTVLISVCCYCGHERVDSLLRQPRRTGPPRCHEDRPVPRSDNA
jgi:hypothetical protein